MTPAQASRLGAEFGPIDEHTPKCRSCCGRGTTTAQTLWRSIHPPPRRTTFRSVHRLHRREGRRVRAEFVTLADLAEPHRV